MAYRADEVKVGFILVVSILILAAFIIAIIGLRIGRETVAYSTSLKFIADIDPGRPVRFGGLQVGKVADMMISKKDNTMITVVMEIDKGTPVKTDSAAFINIIGFVGDYYMEISTGSQDAAVLPPGSEIPGRDVATFNEMVAQAQIAVERINASLEIINKEILMQKLPELQERVVQTTEDMAKVLNDIDKVINENRAGIRQTVDEIRQLVTANREDIDQTVRNFRSASQKLRAVADTLDSIIAENRKELNTVVGDIRAAAADARAAADKVDKLISENANDMTTTVENLKATSTNARNLSEELVDQPWRLLWRTRQPEKKTIEKGK